MFTWEEFFNGEGMIRVNSYAEFKNLCQILAEKGVTWANGKLVGSEGLRIQLSDMGVEMFVNERGILRYKPPASYYVFLDGHLHKTSRYHGREVWSLADCLFEQEVDENGFEKEL